MSKLASFRGEEREIVLALTKSTMNASNAIRRLTVDLPLTEDQRLHLVAVSDECNEAIGKLLK